MSVTLAVIILGVIQCLGFLGFSWLLRRYFDRKQAEIEAKVEAVIRGWVEAPEDGRMSKLGEFLDAVGSIIGRAAAHSIMGALSSQDGKAARLANDLSANAEAKQNPIMALLAGGKRGKGAAVMRLAELLGPMLSRAGGGSDNHGSGASDTFKLE